MPPPVPASRRRRAREEQRPRVAVDPRDGVQAAEDLGSVAERRRRTSPGTSRCPRSPGRRRCWCDRTTPTTAGRAGPRRSARTRCRWCRTRWWWRAGLRSESQVSPDDGWADAWALCVDREASAKAAHEHAHANESSHGGILSLEGAWTRRTAARDATINPAEAGPLVILVPAWSASQREHGRLVGDCSLHLLRAVAGTAVY